MIAVVARACKTAGYARRCFQNPDLLLTPANMFNDDEDLDRFKNTQWLRRDTDFHHRAIALSLLETSKKPTLINLDSEDEDIEEARFQEELKHVLEASKTESSSAPTDVARSSIGNSQITNQSLSQPVVSSFLSERAQLEKERRERQKRLRPPASSSSAAAPDDDDLEEPPAKRHQVSCSNLSFKRSDIPHDSSSKMSLELPTIEQVFWNGELRQTATQGAEPRKDGQATIRLTDVLGKVSFFCT